MRAKIIRGFPVVNLEDGSMLGKVQELLVDPAEKKVAALLVGEKGFLKGRSHFIPYSRVNNIGKDVITVEPEKQLVTADDQAQLENLKKYSFLGNNVITEDGDYLARIQDYTFNPQSGKITSLLLYDFREEMRIKAEMSFNVEGVLNLGRDYIIVRSNYGEYLHEPAMRGNDPIEDTGPSYTPPEAEKKKFKEEPEQEREEQHTSRLFDKLKELWDNLDREISLEGKEVARETREKMRKYLRGKKANYTVRDNQGHPLVLAGDIIEETTIRLADAQGKLGALFLSAISEEIEESMGTIRDKVSSFFRN